MNPITSLPFFFLLFLTFTTANVVSPETYSDEQQPLNPIPITTPTTVPAFPVIANAPPNKTCHLDLSEELFGGVSDACATLDRGRCCPVLAAWLFAAHARASLDLRPSTTPPSSLLTGDMLPMMPDDSQLCVDALQTSLATRDITLPQPNKTCDTVLCFCGIRLHQLSSLECPAAFNISLFSSAGSAARNATPTSALRELEKDCRNASYAGCTRCLGALGKVKGEEKGSSERESRMMSRDCQLMGLTWLLERNKTAYIPTVSAVLRAVLYSAHPNQQRCSPDQENMPLAVDSLQFQRSLAAGVSSSSYSSRCSRFALGFSLNFLVLTILSYSVVL